MIVTAADFWTEAEKPFIKRRIAGIYAIRNLMNQKVYVGSAVSIYDRLYNHIWHLERGTHRNPRLLNAWRKYKLSAFSFEVLEIVETLDLLLEREQCWIDKLDVITSGYNLSPNAGSNLGRVFGLDARKAIASAASKAMADPTVKARHKEATKAAMRDPEVKRKCSEHLKKRWQDPIARAALMSALYNPAVKNAATLKRSEAAKRRWQDPDTRASARAFLNEQRKKYWQDPAARLLASATHKKRFEDPAARLALSEAQKKGWQDLARKKAAGEAQKKRWQDDPARREAARQRLKKRWEDPIVKALLMKSMRGKKKGSRLK